MMSGNNLRRVRTDSTTDSTLDRLTPLAAGPDSTASGDHGVPETLLASAAEDVAAGDLDVDDGLVTQSLDEILLALVAMNGGTHGSRLMADLATLFDAQLSPGTVYPRLHDLDADGMLAMHELVQTKEYAVDDTATAADRIEQAAYDHFRAGLFLYASLDSV